MSFRASFSLITVAIAIHLLFFGDVLAEEIQPKDNPSVQELDGGLQQQQMTLVSLEPCAIDGEVVGFVAAYIYDDAITERPADYFEFYDDEGSLLAVGWFDKFGVQRIAVDRGILEEQAYLEGVFVILPASGTPYDEISRIETVHNKRKSALSDERLEHALRNVASA
jgi:hypothetical protein